MKTTKLISLDIDLVERLKKESNCSELINSLLLDYYGENKDFKKIRLMNKIKLIKLQKKELRVEEEKLTKEVKEFLDKTTTKKEIVEDVKVEVKHHQGAMIKEDLKNAK